MGGRLQDMKPKYTDPRSPLNDMVFRPPNPRTVDYFMKVYPGVISYLFLNNVAPAVFFA